ncbi:Ig-like domain-containing protein [Clostridium botulinum]|uniref:Ig-like domain-containing protein n=1 Tax=Clostridium botulinum TaxID=1491 RepID=UPI000504D8D2|nr:Ig-like domain-containing protein [Clostridium botulinum]KFX58371.1 cell adhesion domain-containing protein [Clostridium botulinum]MBN1071497.1 DUF11 domain-containing protein [Clostridium botulinum]MBY6778603.1 Ig-like domain-containing protein [Clostridium botulinum]MBY6851782.1 Ig-like domain-containing protein [Clostridium botulinum]NFS11542.1 DUF11 domain-containing protein [Clostridium botulinum]
MKNCYKKIGIIFVMVLAIMSVGIIKNEIVANAATVGEQLLQPEEGWKRYDDNDSSITYSTKLSHDSKSWFNSNSLEWCYNNTITDCVYGINTENEYCEFNFYGSKLRVISPYWWSSTPSVDVYIDNKLIGNFSEKGSSDKYQVMVYEIDELNFSKHSVKIVNKDNSGAYFCIDAIDTDYNGYLVNTNEENQSILLSQSSLNLKEGISEKLTVTTTSSAVGIDWSSSDETVATVDSNGNVKAIKEGQATITAKIKGTDIKSTCIVTITKKDVPVEPEQPTNPEQEYIINTAYAKGDNTNNASGQVSIIFKGIAEAQLKVIKTADVDSVYVGDNFTYTIEVTNTSDKIAKSVVIKDNAPNHIQFIPSEVITTQGKIDSSSTSKNIIVNVGDIPPSGKVIIKIPVLVVE